MQFEALTANLTSYTVMLRSFICIRMLHREIYNPRICLHWSLRWMVGKRDFV